MPLTITQMPHRDAGTGEHSQADGPVSFYADDTTNEPAEGTEDRPESVTTRADDVNNQPAEGGVDREPTTHVTDFPVQSENKSVKAEQADTKSEPEPKQATAKRAAKKGS